MNRVKFIVVLICFTVVGMVGGGWASSVNAAPVTGRLTTAAGVAVPGEVLVWPLASRTLATGASHRVKSDKEGLYRLDLAVGDYYFLAQGEGLFAYYGRNPVHIPEEGSTLNLSLVPRPNDVPSQEMVEIDSGVVGRVTTAGKPLAGAIIFVYPDLSSRLKGAGLGMSAPSDSDGFFELPLSTGTYYLLARKRNSGQSIGPLAAGDFIGYLPDNPLVIKEETVARVAIPMLEVPHRVEKFAASLFGGSSVAGTVTDLDGNPVAGIRVLLYDEATMLARPLHVSQPTDAQGRFLLSFADGGTYYLVARAELGGTPQPGELYGQYNENQDHALTIKEGEQRQGVKLVVEEMW